MNLPRPNLLRQELSNIGVVYTVVLILLGVALLYRLAPSAETPINADTAPPAALGPTRE